MPHESLNLDPKAAPGDMTGNLRNYDETEADNAEFQGHCARAVQSCSVRKGAEATERDRIQEFKGCKFLCTIQGEEEKPHPSGSGWGKEKEEQEDVSGNGGNERREGGREGGRG